MARRRPLAAATILAALLPCGAGPAAAQPTEAAVKAAFLPKFARYIELPASLRPAPGQPYVLCLIGRDAMGRLVDQAAASELVGGAPVAVRRLAGAEGAEACHLAFVLGPTEQSTGQWLAQLARQGVLTITDARGGRARGMIHFAVVSGRVRFHIDEAAAAAHGIAISSRLLALAVSVKQKP
jgi:hypothetical protein